MLTFHTGKSTFIGKLEEFSLSGLPLAGGGGVYSGDSSTHTGIASSLHSSRRQWREQGEADGHRGSRKGVATDTASCVVAALKKRCFVSGREFGSSEGATAGGTARKRQASTAEGLEKVGSDHEGNALTNYTSQLKSLHKVSTYLRILTDCLKPDQSLMEYLWISTMWNTLQL